MSRSTVEGKKRQRLLLVPLILASLSWSALGIYAKDVDEVDAIVPMHGPQSAEASKAINVSDGYLVEVERHFPQGNVSTQRRLRGTTKSAMKLEPQSAEASEAINISHGDLVDVERHFPQGNVSTQRRLRGTTKGAMNLEKLEKAGDASHSQAALVDLTMAHEAIRDTGGGSEGHANASKSLEESTSIDNKENKYFIEEGSLKKTQVSAEDQESHSELAAVTQAAPLKWSSAVKFKGLKTHLHLNKKLGICLCKNQHLWRVLYKNSEGGFSFIMAREDNLEAVAAAEENNESPEFKAYAELRQYAEAGSKARKQKISNGLRECLMAVWAKAETEAELQESLEGLSAEWRVVGRPTSKGVPVEDSSDKQSVVTSQKRAAAEALLKLPLVKKGAFNVRHNA